MVNVVVGFLTKTKRAEQDLDRLVKKIEDFRSALGKLRNKTSSSGGSSSLLPLPTLHGGQAELMRQYVGQLTPGFFGANVDKMISSGVPASLNRATEAIQKVLSAGKFGLSGDALTFATNSYINSIKKMTPAVAGATKGLLSFSGVLKKVVVALGYVLTKMVKYGRQAEDAIAAMEVLYGSEQKAIAEYQKAVEFSVRSPFTPIQVTHATQTAAQFGMTDIFKKGAYGLGPDQRLADILAGMGSFTTLGPGGHRGAPIGMERAAQAVFRGDYRLLRPFRGLITPAYKQAQQAGMAGSPEFTAVFVRELGKIPQIMRMAERASRTVSGLWATIVGTMQVFFINLSGAAESSGILTFWKFLRNIVQEIRNYLVEAMAGSRETLSDVGAFLGQTLDMIWNLVKAYVMFKTAIIQFLAPILIPLLKIILSLVGFLFEMVGVVLNGIVDLIKAFLRLMFDSMGLQEHWVRLIAYLNEAVVEVKQIVMFWGIALRGWFDELYNGLEDTIDRMMAKISNFFATLSGFVRNHRSTFNVITFGGADELAQDLQDISNRYSPTHQRFNRELRRYGGDVRNTPRRIPLPGANEFLTPGGSNFQPRIPEAVSGGSVSNTTNHYNNTVINGATPQDLTNLTDRSGAPVLPQINYRTLFGH